MRTILRSSCVASGIMLGLAMALSTPAAALTPKRSPEQLARDDVLFARASQDITPRVMQCFEATQTRPRKPFKVRFFLADAGRRAAQFEILEAGPSPRAARSRPERAAIQAIKTCAPYTLPEELRGWGGFWATVSFK